MNKKKFLFLTLNIFSSTGGIEKVCKIVAKAIQEIAIEENVKYAVYSMHDSIKNFDKRYIDINCFKAFNKQKLYFSSQALKQGVCSDIIILSHVNLLLFGALLKLIVPSKKVVLFVHGIEVWGALPNWKKILINKCNTVICVSNYTKNVMVEKHKIKEAKCHVLNNCIDPFLQSVPTTKNETELKTKLRLQESDFILLTVSRLSSHDRDKGIDKVLLALKQLIKQYPNLKYIVIGKYQLPEKKWLDEIISQYGLQKNVSIVGYVTDNELMSYMNLSDIYIMPSKKEGFGIIFIEALFFGKPVIAGNIDGSVDALANGEFGVLVNPDSNVEIVNAIKSIMLNKEKYIPNHNEVMEKFGYSTYKKSLRALLESSNN